MSASNLIDLIQFCNLKTTFQKASIQIQRPSFCKRECLKTGLLSRCAACHRRGSKEGRYTSQVRGLMDKAPAYGAGDCGFESHRICHFCHMLFIDGGREERLTHSLVTKIRLYGPMTMHILLV